MSNPIKSIRFARGTFLSLFVAVLLLTCRAGQHRMRASDPEYCSGSRCVGGWFGMEGCLRHPGQGWLQRQHRPGTGNLFQRRCGCHEARPCSCRMGRAFLSVTVMGEP